MGNKLLTLKYKIFKGDLLLTCTRDDDSLKVDLWVTDPEGDWGPGLKMKDQVERGWRVFWAILDYARAIVNWMIMHRGPHLHPILQERNVNVME